MIKHFTNYCLIRNKSKCIDLYKEVIDDEAREINEVDAPEALKKKRREKLFKQRVAEKLPIIFNVVEYPLDEEHNVLLNLSKVTINDHFVTCTLNIEILTMIPTQAIGDLLWRNLVSGVDNQIKSQIKFISNKVSEREGDKNLSYSIPEVINVYPKTFCSHFMQLIYPYGAKDKDLVEERKILIRKLFLPSDYPLIRKCNRYVLANERHSVYLMNVHEGVTSDLKDGSVHLVQGDYEYRHYMQDKMNDNGWGCAYRSLQTIVSWFKLQGYVPDSFSVPDHKCIQQTLVDVGDKEASFVGSNKWIGSQEVKDNRINLLTVH